MVSAGVMVDHVGVSLIFLVVFSAVVDAVRRRGVVINTFGVNFVLGKIRDDVTKEPI